MYIKNFAFVILFSFILFFSHSIEKYVDIDLIKKAGPPRYLDSGVLITISPDQGRTVFLRTNADGWKDDHFFHESLFGIKYYIIPYEENVPVIKYKLNMDGFWDRDPNNADFTDDKYGTDISYVKVPEEFLYHKETPLIEMTDNPVKNVIFLYDNPGANEVNFVSSIDNWNQFTHQMKKNSDGIWEFRMDFKKGTYYYYFIVDEKKIIDNENRRTFVDEGIGRVSAFVIK